MRGLKYISWSDCTGFGTAALGNVRALAALDVPLWWAPMCTGADGRRQWRPEFGIEALDCLRTMPDDEAYADLPDLMARCGAPRDYDTVVVHLPPEHWPVCFESGKRNFGYAALETDCLPPHWPTLFALADRVLVPSTMNRDVCLRAGVRAPVDVVPHVFDRPALRSDGERKTARAALGAGADTTIFYSINTWDPRKGNYDLLAAYADAFSAGDNVLLVVKTQSHGIGPAPDYTPAAVPRLLDDWRVTAQSARSTPLPAINLIAREVTARAIDDLHLAGDVFVSLSRGEGWGLGAFEAMGAGRPVVMTGWGGQLDFLGADWPWLIDYQMAPVEPWPGQGTHLPPQRWAQPDLAHASRQLRAARDDLPAAMHDAHAAAARLRQDFSPAAIGRQLLASITGA